MRRRPSTETELWCAPCRTMHPKTAFGKDKNTPDGLTHACKDVVQQRNKTSHIKKREFYNVRHAQRRKFNKQSDQRVTWALKKLLADAARRASVRKLDFAITLQDLEPVERCPIFGVTLVYQAEKRPLPSSASLDRIDSRKGYVPENVWIISWRANQIKNDATPDEMRQIADAVDEQLRKKNAGRTLDGKTWDQSPTGVR